jgi:hypothetical protein
MSISQKSMDVSTTLIGRNSDLTLSISFPPFLFVLFVTVAKPQFEPPKDNVGHKNRLSQNNELFKGFFISLPELPWIFSVNSITETIEKHGKRNFFSSTMYICM